MGSEEYDWLRFVVGYTITRLGLLLALVLFGAFTGAVLFPSLVTFLPYSMVGVKNFFTQPDVKSLVCTVVICLFLIWVFFDDGKKHTAYEEWSLTTILAVLILVGMFYFIPAIFRDSFHAEGKGDIFYMVLYYPAGWLIDLFDDNYIIGIMFSILVMLGTAFSAYVISYKNYVKKHPVLLSSGGRSVISDEDEDAGYDDTDE